MKQITITFSEELGSLKIDTKNVKGLGEVLLLLQLAHESVMRKVTEKAVINVQNSSVQPINEFTGDPERR